MDQQETKLAVLARFPDLSEDNTPTGSGKSIGGGMLASTGRLINQVVSFKLLAGIMMFLLVGAVLPFSIGRNRPATDDLSSKDSQATCPAESASELADAAPAQSAPIVQPAVRRPVVLVPVTAEPSSAPAIVPSQFEVEGAAKRGPAAESPLMSSWLNPASADARQSGAEERQPGTNAGLPTAIRPPEYRAGSIR